MKIYEGRPDHNEGRLEKELAVYDLLDELEIAYERVDHEALQTIEAVSYTHLDVYKRQGP